MTKDLRCCCSDWSALELTSEQAGNGLGGSGGGGQGGRAGRGGAFCVFVLDPPIISGLVEQKQRAIFVVEKLCPQQEGFPFGFL